MENKYEFTGETMNYDGHILQRIRYLRKGKYFSKSTLGGWIEHEGNLSHDENCAILHESKVLGNARVMNDAVVLTKAVLKDNVQLLDSACVSGKAIIGADTIIGDDVVVEGDSKIFFYADEHYGRYNILEYTEIDGCYIEGTGTIENCELLNVKLEGLLMMEHEKKSQRFKNF